VYLEYYNLKEAPFDITPNPRFLFFSPKHARLQSFALWDSREKRVRAVDGRSGCRQDDGLPGHDEQLGERYATALILNPVLDADNW